MATALTMIELRSMSKQDLEREIRGKRIHIGALRLAVSIGKEKNTSVYKKEKKELARLLTVLCEKDQTKPLNVQRDAATVRAQS